MNPHLAAEPVRAGVPLAGASAVAVLCHGRDQGPETMEGLARRLDLDGVHYVLPVADGLTWYPGRYTDPVADNEPRLSQALEAYGAAVEGLRADGWKPERIALVGFSQGGCVTLEWGARNPRRYGALAGVTASLIGPPDGLTEPPGSLAGTPTLVTTCVHDDWMSEETTRASAEVLTRAGARVDCRILPAGEHSVKDEEVDAIRALIEATREGAT